MAGAVTVLEEKGREEQKRKRIRGWGERTGVRKKREKRGEEGRRSVQWLLRGQGQGQKQPLLIKHRVPPLRALCMLMAWFIAIIVVYCLSS